MKHILLIIGLLFYTVLLLAQPNFSKAYRVHDNEDFLCGFGSLTVTDSAYYISGGTNDTLHGYSIDRGMLMKIDTNGNKAWVEVYGDTLKTALTSSNSMIVTNQGYLARVGRHRDWTGCLLLTDFDGNVIFNKSYPSNIPNHTVYLNKVVQDDNSNFYLIGNLYDYYGDDDGLLIKTDSLGNELWRRTYSNPPYNRLLSSDILDIGNNEYIITYNVSENEYHQFSYKDGTWIFKIDSAGNILNEYKTPYNRWVSGYNTTITKDKGILFCHTEGLSRPNTNPSIPEYNYEGYVGKLDSSLQLVWERRYGSKRTQFAHAIEKDNGEILLTGSLVSDLSVDSVRLTGWLMALDENGDSLWQREYALFSGTRQLHLLKDFEILDDGRLVISGWINNTNSYANVGTARSYWGWLIRTDSFGCIVPGCQLLDNTENISVIFDNEVTVYPNPASEVVRFRFEKLIEKDAVIRIYSGLGQLVDEININYSNEGEMNVSDWHTGTYHYGIYIEGRLVKQGQILVQD